jgi:triphosphoribosyl-dephospho-CoA synthase
MGANVLVTNILGVAAANLGLCNHLAALATQALIAEAELTPKPGLVDRRGSGAHTDLSLELLRRSATVLEPYFATMAYISAGLDVNTGLREELAVVGRDAERAMYKATNGSNTHKGAIWTLGLLVGAAARRDGQKAKHIAATAGAIARLPDRKQPAVVTHGDIALCRYGAGGAREEAANGFPHVIKFGLPTLRRQRARRSPEEVSRLDALLSVMSQLNDTCVLYRGGVAALDVVKSGAHAVLMAGGHGTALGRVRMRRLDREVIARRVSPGGSADLLAATIFLDAVERQQSEVHKDRSEWEERDGAA